MASLSDVIVANNAAVTTSQEFEELLKADFALLHATRELLSTVRDMKLNARLRLEAPQSVIDFSKQLASLMEKYGIELIPSAIHVQGMDLRVLGTDTAVRRVAYHAGVMTTIPPQPIGQGDFLHTMMQEAKNMTEQACGIRPYGAVVKSRCT